MIKFEKIILHNFGSYAHSEIDFHDKGFCLVTGQNLFKKDDADSNGSGKSTFINAISACLTGETLSGVRSGFKNLHIEEDVCYITLNFYFDRDAFEITRHFNPKSDLKIIKNGTDISGKGISESKKILAELLPDITKDLLASTITIGQGMPNRLTLNPPSGRKDVLEKLTKTDFMIEDVKERVSNRLLEVSQKIREIDDALLVKNTKKSSLEPIIEALTKELEEIVKPDKVVLDNLKEQLASKQKESQELSTKLKQISDQIEFEYKELTNLNNKKNTELSNLNEEFQTRLKPLSEDKTILSVKISNLKHEIQHLKSIVDVCPTCHQHLPNIFKPSTVEQEKELSVLQESYSLAEDKIKNLNQKLTENHSMLESMFASDLKKLDDSAKSLKTEQMKLNSEVNRVTSDITRISTNIVSLEKDLLNYEANIEAKTKKLESSKVEKDKLTQEITNLSLSRAEFEQRLLILKKMETLVKRDFRGILLQNVIKYLDKKAKDFSQIVFGTRDLNIYLDGNNLDVSYDGRLIESLSGGERMKVDLIVQLALRNLLINYFNMSSNILALDEVTDYLDKKGCDKIMSLIQSELNVVESVFIISHRADDLEIPIDNYLHVVKNEEGISEISEQ